MRRRTLPLLVTGVTVSCTALVGLTAGSAGAIEAGKMTYLVTLKAANGNFVSAVYGGGGAVQANQSRADAWETFTLFDPNAGTLVDGDLVQLRTSNRRYLSAAWGGGAALEATATESSTWETFRIDVVGAGTGTAVTDGARVALQTRDRGTWVSVRSDASGTVDASASAAGTAETFVLGLRSTLGPKGPFVSPVPGQTTGSGVLPPAPARADYLGKMQFDFPVARDLGFSSVVNGQSVWTFGDTLVPDGKGGWQITASDSVALGDASSPMRIHDKNINASNWPQEWIPLNAQEEANGGLGRYGMGGTNVVEIASGKALVWYLRNNRGSGGRGIEGAGVSTVVADANGAVASRVHDLLWSADEPWWGDIGVTYNPQDKSVYVYGHGPAGTPEGHVYLAKVPADRALDKSAYSYWDESRKAWTTQRFTASGQSGTVRITGAQALFKNRDVGQSNAFWSNYYNTWMFVAGADVGYTDIQVKTAPKLEGPWTTSFTVASTCPTGTCTAVRYAIAPHPEYDSSGKTLLVTWTDDNVIHATRITWK